MESREMPTPRGPARLTLDRPAGRGRPSSLLALGHGASGGVDTRDLLAVRDAALGARVVVARVTQPYRVAGRRAPAPAAQLDEAWRSVIAALAAEFPGVPVVAGGRSSGARVACRTARDVGAAGVVALAFPLHPPGKPDRSRAPELLTGVPTLVVNGDRDPFGVPAPAAGIDLVVRGGEGHDLRRDPVGVATAVLDWLRKHHWAS